MAYALMQTNESRRTEPDRRQALLEERVLILVPAESDAKFISAAAAQGGFTAEIAADMAHLCAAISEGAGAVVLTIHRGRKGNAKAVAGRDGALGMLNA